MLHVIWGIIKVLLYILLAIICFILATTLLIVFFPFSYKINVEAKENINGGLSVGWLFYIFYIRIEYNDKEFTTKLKLFGIPISFGKKNINKFEKETEENAKDVFEATEEVVNTNTVENDAGLAEDNKEKCSEDEALEESFKRLENNKKQDKKKNKKKKSKLKNKENKDSILDGLKRAYAEFKDESNRAAFRAVKSEAIKILKSIRPVKYKANLKFGFEDPSLTGEVLGLIALLYPKLREDVHVIPDFTAKVFEGDLYLKGRIIVCTFILAAIRLLLNKDIRKVIKKLRK